MALQIKFNGVKVGLHGGHAIAIEGVLQTEASNVLVFGFNGNGKSLILSTISHYFQYPSGDIKYIDVSKINLVATRIIKKVVTVRQNASSNFASNMISDEFKLVYADSSFGKNSFYNELIEYLSGKLDIDQRLFSRNYKTLSSGEKQIISVGLAILSKADLILLDEPTARLSNRNAGRLIELLEGRKGDSFAIMTAHLSELEHTSKLATSTNAHRLIKSDNVVSIKGYNTDLVRIALRQDIVQQLEDLYISSESFTEESAWSKHFVELPANSVRSISGSGANLTDKPLNIEVKIANEPVTNIQNLCLRQGLNFIYGDNGSGKSLTAQVLAGQHTFRGGVLSRLIRRPQLHIAADVPPFDLSQVNWTRQQSATLSWLAKHVQSYYLAGEPDSFLLEEHTVRNEVMAACDQKNIMAILKWLGQFGIEEHILVRSLSYGQKKLLAFALLPQNLVLSILDEPLTNIAYEYQLVLCRKILDNIASKHWHSVVITTNRPLETINLFYRSIVDR